MELRGGDCREDLYAVVFAESVFGGPSPSLAHSVFGNSVGDHVGSCSGSQDVGGERVVELEWNEESSFEQTGNRCRFEPLAWRPVQCYDERAGSDGVVAALVGNAIDDIVLVVEHVGGHVEVIGVGEVVDGESDGAQCGRPWGFNERDPVSEERVLLAGCFGSEGTEAHDEAAGL